MVEFEVWGLGFEVLDLGFGVWGCWSGGRSFGIGDSRFRAPGAGVRVKDSGETSAGLVAIVASSVELGVCSLQFGGWGSGFRVQG